MNISNNIDLITLECLKNNNLYKQINKNINIKTKINKNDKKFYKKRIINEFKNMLKNEFPIDSLKNPFNSLIISLIEYFKMIDTKDIIQHSYIDLDISSNQNNNIEEQKYYDNEVDNNDDILVDLSMNNQDKDNKYLNSTNKLFYNLNYKKNNKLNNFIVSNKTKEIINYPIIKELDLKNPNLKTKGIKE